MDISGTRKCEGLSDATALVVTMLVARIRAKARAKRASHLQFFRVFGDGAVRSKARGEKKGTDKGSSSTGSPDEGVVSGNEAEAAGRNLVYPLLAQAVHKQNKGGPRVSSNQTAVRG